MNIQVESNMELNAIEKEFSHLILSDVKIVQIISYEALRVHGMLIKIAKLLNKNLFFWNRVEGFKEWDFTNNTLKMYKSEGDIENKGDKENEEDIEDPDTVFNFYNSNKNIILLLEDYHPDLDESNPKTIRNLRNIAFKENVLKNTLVLLQPYHLLPKELEKEIHIIDLPYPTKNDLKSIYKKVARKYNFSERDIHNPDDVLIESALGLTIMEAEKAFSLAYIQDRQLTSAQITHIIKEKENIIKKSGYLEYYHPKDKMNEVGGLDNLKDWLEKRHRGFYTDAKDFGLDYPRGILLLGIPGTGKSLTAKAIGCEWQFPLLRLDMGKIFGGVVGESERNIREALKIAEAISPSILWIDEIEKGFSGLSSSGNSDGGTTSRVLGTFLTWMQEKTKPVFVVATANNISQLPPELLRKGRVDEIFFVDLPTEQERKNIVEIHLKKKSRYIKDFDIDAIAKVSKGFSGAELEEAIKDALFQAYADGRDIETTHILNAIQKTFPLSQTMHDVILEMRKWAKSKAILASKNPPEALEKTNVEIPKLKQESYDNPFA